MMCDVCDEQFTARSLVVHDYSGHPFQVQLSRELARRGYVVHHQYSSTYVSGHGDMKRQVSDPPSLTITDVPLNETFVKYNAGRRLLQELEYAWKAFRAIRSARPDAAVLCNIPLVANFLLVIPLVLFRQRYVFWHQDVYSAAMREQFEQRLAPPLARLLGALAEGMEKLIARRAHHVVGITDAFADKYAEWGLSQRDYTIIPNWAALGPLPADGVGRGWLAGHPLRRNLLLYAGTLGLKHDPGLLLELARAPELADCTVVVVSEGRGREWLSERLHDVDEARLLLVDYVAFDQLPGVLASADVLLSILEPAASRFSVPSKVLTYLCAGRPVVAVMDPDNSAARMLTQNLAGVVVDHADRDSLPRVVRSLLDSAEERAALGKAARALAERTFDINAIADRFEQVLQEAVQKR